jgi:hypothetical protein
MLSVTVSGPPRTVWTTGTEPLPSGEAGMARSTAVRKPIASKGEMIPLPRSVTRSSPSSKPNSTRFTSDRGLVVGFTTLTPSTDLVARCALVAPQLAHPEHDDVRRLLAGGDHAAIPSPGRLVRSRTKWSSRMKGSK